VFRTVLVANRGEIAVRIIQACQELGVRAVAVYSEADRDALHVARADDAIPIGPAPAADSYLNVSRLIEAARACGAEAVHPGYGFLAENAAFAAACEAAGLVFIGPPPAALRLLGDKPAAKQLARRAGVPVVPGYQGASQAPGRLFARARALGFPLLIKAAAGGGGRGMRRVADAAAFLPALAQARREAEAAFGDPRVLLERDLTPARHVEVQFLADRHGAVIALGERDCSVQRRHQKLLEEAPAPGLTAAERARLARWATRLARAAGYVGAGTAEFLRDAAGQYYFLEVNARLQVEHPVTELVYGVDLVHWQLRIAAGEPLPLRAADLVPRGHAIEARLYAEDPAHGFQPTSGPITAFEPPLGPGLRHDVGVRAGDTVSRYYDTLLAKLIAHGPDRATALRRLAWALERYVIEGPPTNRELLLAVASDADFQAGHLRTDFLEQHPALLAPAPAAEAALWAAVAADLAGLGGLPAAPAAGPWTAVGPWRGRSTPHTLRYCYAGAEYVVHARPEAPGVWGVRLAGAEAERRLEAEARGGRLHARLDGVRLAAAVVVQREPPALVVQLGGRRHRFERPPPPRAPAAVVGEGVPAGLGPAPGVAPPPAGRDDRAGVRAPTAGLVVAVYVQAGDAVAAGQPVVALEAMKIEQSVPAPRAGRVRAVRCAVGDTVAAGALLVELADEP
jgi:3-methylcrotonyl-CoA carboxylase alpha subunit